MPQVLVRIDAAGEYPVVVDDEGTQLAGEAGASWRYVCDVGTIAEGHRVCAVWLARRQPMTRSGDSGPTAPDRTA